MAQARSSRASSASCRAPSTSTAAMAFVSAVAGASSWSTSAGSDPRVDARLSSAPSDLTASPPASLVAPASSPSRIVVSTTGSIIASLLVVETGRREVSRLGFEAPPGRAGEATIVRGVAGRIVDLDRAEPTLAEDDRGHLLDRHRRRNVDMAAEDPGQEIDAEVVRGLQRPGPGPTVERPDIRGAHLGRPSWSLLLSSPITGSTLLRWWPDQTRSLRRCQAKQVICPFPASAGSGPSHNVR